MRASKESQINENAAINTADRQIGAIAKGRRGVVFAIGADQAVKSAFV